MSENDIKPVRRFAVKKDVDNHYIGMEFHSIGAYVLYGEHQSAIDRLTAERDAAESQRNGYMEQHCRDSAELRAVCAERDEAQRKLSVAVANGNALVADAERYRFLRNAPIEFPAEGVEVAIWDDGYGEAIRGDVLDAAIDAARAEGGV